MNKTRIALLQAVTDAAREMMIRWDAEGMADMSKVRAALTAHDAAPPPPKREGEVVEVRAGVYRSGPGVYSVMGVRYEDGQIVVTQTDNLVATITALVPLPVVPTIQADVEGE